MKRLIFAASLVLGLLGLAYLGFVWSGQGEAMPTPAELALLRARAASEPPAPTRPERPPVKGVDEPFSLPEPEPPPDVEAMRARAYAEAVERGDPRPAEAAFRATVKLFVEHNRQFADQQAQEEGLTVEEVEELTAFGMLAQQTQRWSEVERVLGQELDPATKEAGEALMHDANAAFKEAMRRLVASGAPESERWRLIRETQDAYRRRYFATTGMNEALLEQLLAGDPSRKYAGNPSPDPAVLAQRQAEQPETSPPVKPGDAPQGEPESEEASSETAREDSGG